MQNLMQTQNLTRSTDIEAIVEDQQYYDRTLHIADIITRHMHIDAPIIHMITQPVVIHIVS
jgi:hypothetical protein